MIYDPFNNNFKNWGSNSTFYNMYSDSLAYLVIECRSL